MNKRHPPIQRECEICKERFKSWVSTVKRGQGRFCSRKCRGINQTQQGVYIKNCIICQKEFKLSGSRKTKGFGFYCSKECMGLSYRTPYYNPDENLKIRKSHTYNKWRQSVYKRDNWTCQDCGLKGVKLHADHIKPFALFPNLRLELSNGRTLCVECHRKTPTYGGGSHKI